MQKAPVFPPADPFEEHLLSPVGAPGEILRLNPEFRGDDQVIHFASRQFVQPVSEKLDESPVCPLDPAVAVRHDNPLGRILKKLLQEGLFLRQGKLGRLTGPDVPV